MSSIRSPIVSVLGHVDHGKSSVLDAIRDTNILNTEAGGITQAIGASIVPVDTLMNKCGTLLDKMGVKLTIPGLLFIDTPGHAAFTSLRKRGGNLADIAVVVVDINEGFKPQTIEAIDILRAAKTPFIIAANKLDLIPRFAIHEGKPILGMVTSQAPDTQQLIDKKIYEIVGQMHEKFGMQAERFDRVDDFTQQIAIIPLSALKQIGLSELLMVLSALAQKFLEKNLLLDESGPAKGTVLEIKEEQGLGKTMDVIMYNGTLNVNDTVVLGTINNPLVTRVKAMFEPEPHCEMRDKKSAFRPVKTVHAATGVKLSCPESDGVISGMPLISCENNEEEINQAKEFIQSEINDANIELDIEGVVIKADNIGSLEALSVLLREKGFQIRKASIGEISKKDVTDAQSNHESDPLHSVILGFNIPQVQGNDQVKIFTSPIIYHLIDEYDAWRIEEEKRIAKRKLEGLMRPCKMQVLANCIFRQSNPCVAGIEILQGTLTTHMPLMKSNGDKLTTTKELQLDKKNVQSADKGKQVAVSLPNVTGGRQVNELDILYSDIPPPIFRELRKHAKLLDPEEIEILKEIAEIKRKSDPFWGK